MRPSTILGNSAKMPVGKRGGEAVTPDHDAEEEEEEEDNASFSEGMEGSDPEDSDYNDNSSDEDELSKTRVTVNVWKGRAGGGDEGSDDDDFDDDCALDDDNLLVTVKLNDGSRKPAESSDGEDNRATSHVGVGREPQGEEDEEMDEIQEQEQKGDNMGVIVLGRRDPFNRESSRWLLHGHSPPNKNSTNIHAVEEAIALQGGHITARQKRWMKLCDENEMCKLLASPAAKPRECANNKLAGSVCGEKNSMLSSFTHPSLRFSAAFDTTCILTKPS
jgi:hypothetical protein